MAVYMTGSRDEADAQFDRLRDEKTKKTSKTIDAARVKATAEKTARLKAARLAKAEADAAEKT